MRARPRFDPLDGRSLAGAGRSSADPWRWVIGYVAPFGWHENAVLRKRRRREKWIRGPEPWVRRAPKPSRRAFEATRAPQTLATCVRGKPRSPNPRGVGWREGGKDPARGCVRGPSAC